jgi:DNA-binding protein HU-beta
MADARRMGKSELFSHFAERFEVKRTQAREYFDELTQLAEKELKRSGEFVLPGMVKLKARIAKQLKDAVLPRK